MHIPDGYLSPATSAVMYAAVAPFWYLAGRKMKKLLTARTVPMLAVFSAFAFTLQMFNVPLPGGTTGHGVGVTLLAIILGPWAAVIGISMVFIVQALFFGDGGVTAIGANTFNMAVIGAFAGYIIYRLFTGNSPVASRRHIIGAIAGSYLAMNLSAFITALELGIQPLLFKSAEGIPLYAPYGLNVAIPAMMAGHLLIAGPIEAVATGLVVAYLRRSHPHLLQASRTPPTEKVSRSLKPLWIGLGIMILFTPLGLLAPGTAWGEWGAEELQGMGLGFVPAGLERLSGLWPALFSGYTVPGWGAEVGYVISAILGIGIIMGIVLGISAIVNKRVRKSRAEGQGG